MTEITQTVAFVNVDESAILEKGRPGRMKTRRPGRGFVPGESGHELEERRPLDAEYAAVADDEFYPAGAWGGPIEIRVPPLPPLDPALAPPPPAPPPPDDAGDAVAPIEDPFEDPFAPAPSPRDSLPDAPNPPQSADPSFPPDE